MILTDGTFTSTSSATWEEIASGQNLGRLNVASLYKTLWVPRWVYLDRNDCLMVIWNDTNFLIAFTIDRWLSTYLVI